MPLFIIFNYVNTIFSIFIVCKCINMYNNVEKRIKGSLRDNN